VATSHIADVVTYPRDQPQAAAIGVILQDRIVLAKQNIVPFFKAYTVDIELLLATVNRFEDILVYINFVDAVCGYLVLPGWFMTWAGIHRATPRVVMPRGVSFFRWQTVQDAHEPGEETVRRFLRQSSQYVFFVAALFCRRPFRLVQDSNVCKSLSALSSAISNYLRQTFFTLVIIPICETSPVPAMLLTQTFPYEIISVDKDFTSQGLQ
jgi:hypothetical protein